MTSAFVTNPSTVVAQRVSFASLNELSIIRSAHHNKHINNSINRRQTPTSRAATSLEAATSSSDLIPARRTRFAFELKTFLRVLFPALLSGTAAFLSLPALCFRVSNFVTRTTDPGKIGMLSDAVQSFISLVGLLYSILMGQVFGFLYSQQEVSLFGLVWWGVINK
jgi:hypothetical protein